MIPANDARDQKISEGDIVRVKTRCKNLGRRATSAKDFPFLLSFLPKLRKFRRVTIHGLLYGRALWLPC
jgi:hypothetical protein